MKNLLLTIALVGVACAVAFGAFYVTNTDQAARRAARSGDTLAWLRTEFHLNDAQYATIDRLHADFEDACADHCMAIMSAKKSLRTARLQTPAAVPLQEEQLQQLEARCVDEMMTHFHRVAAVMSPAEGSRYLALVLPRVQAYDHRGAPDLQAKP